jgi:hypothetical protein
MTVFRAIALLILLLLLVAPQPAAQAGVAPPPMSQSSEALSIRHVAFGGQCPRLCVEWFDGCNNCTCGHGRIDVCTRRYCFWRGRPRCLRFGF